MNKFILVGSILTTLLNGGVLTVTICLGRVVPGDMIVDLIDSDSFLRTFHELYIILLKTSDKRERKGNDGAELFLVVCFTYSALSSEEHSRLLLVQEVATSTLLVLDLTSIPPPLQDVCVTNADVDMLSLRRPAGPERDRLLKNTQLCIILLNPEVSDNQGTATVDEDDSSGLLSVQRERPNVV